jgi:hypothetical protein
VAPKGRGLQRGRRREIHVKHDIAAASSRASLSGQSCRSAIPVAARISAGSGLHGAVCLGEVTLLAPTPDAIKGCTEPRWCSLAGQSRRSPSLCADHCRWKCPTAEDAVSNGRSTFGFTHSKDYFRVFINSEGCYLSYS